jgi:hypothetical protein
VATLLADPAPAIVEQPPDREVAAAHAEPLVAPATPQLAERACANCGTVMQGAQEWCLQCGAGAPGSLADDTAGRRSATMVLIAVAFLALGAAGAGYAALNRSRGRIVAVTRTVAQVAPPVTTTPSLSAASVTATSSTPKTIGSPAKVKPLLPLAAAKPPEIPLVRGSTPEASAAPALPGTAPASKPSAAPTGGSGTTRGSPPEPLLLDTNAAATYNPYGYPDTNFGEPSLAIDGDPSTGWTAQVDPSAAPKMAEGLAIDLKTPQRLSALELVTSTPGMAVQVYATDSQPLPPSITDHAWVKLSPTQTVKTSQVRINLTITKSFRFVILWISSAPAASVGAPQEPGHVSIDELELFPSHRGLEDVGQLR